MQKQNISANYKKLLLGFIVGVFLSLQIQAKIQGKIVTDSTWNKSVYISLIPDFSKLNSMSNQMIIDKAEVNNDGKFSFSNEYLLPEFYFYRLHLSKKGNPQASLIIGGNDQNYFYFIANKESDITISSLDSIALFKNTEILNSPETRMLCEVNKMLLYIDTTNFYNTPLKRELMENALDEKLRQFADTCSFPLVALYAIYKSNFEDHVKSNPDFYVRFLEKWESEKSPYFKKFRETIPIRKSRNYSSIKFAILGFGIGILFMFFLFRRKSKTTKNPMQDLTVQERNIFSLLQQGKSNKEISDELSISLSTVKSHVNNIFSKMNIKSRKEILN